MKTLKRIAARLGMASGASVVGLAFFFGRVFSSAPGFFQWGAWRDYAFVAIVASLGLAVIVVAYCFGFRWDPAAQSGGSGRSDGPPSVS